MKTFGLKKWLIVLVAFFGFASIGSAQNIGAGFHWGSGLGGQLVINLSKGLALRGNLDIGLGNYATADFGATFGFDFSLNFRIPLIADGTELYFGPGIVFSGGSGQDINSLGQQKWDCKHSCREHDGAENGTNRSADDQKAKPMRCEEEELYKLV